MEVYKPTHILDFNERLFQDIMTLFNVTTDEEEINPRLASRKKNKKFVSKLISLFKFNFACNCYGRFLIHINIIMKL